MSYSDKNAIIERLSENEVIDLASETETMDAAAEAIVVTCVRDADQEIDSHISSRYPTPLSTVPDLIKKLSVELAIINLNKKRNIFSDDVIERQKWTKSVLEKLAKGIMTLSITFEDPPQKILFESNELRGW